MTYIHKKNLLNRWLCLVKVSVSSMFIWISHGCVGWIVDKCSPAWQNQIYMCAQYITMAMILCQSTSPVLLVFRWPVLKHEPRSATCLWALWQVNQSVQWKWSHGQKCWGQNPSWQCIIDWSHLLPIHVRVCCAYLAIYTSYVDLQLFTTLVAMLLWSRINTRLSDLNYLGWLGHFLDHMGLRVKHIL